MEDIKCPTCGGSDLVRWGKGSSGAQKYRCQNPKCKRQFVAGSDHLLDPGKKEAALKLLAAGTAPRTVATALGISVRWTYELKRQLKRRDPDARV